MTLKSIESKENRPNAQLMRAIRNESENNKSLVKKVYNRFI